MASHRFFSMKPSFSVMQPQTEKLGKTYLPIVPRSSHMKFHKILSKDCGEMALGGQDISEKHFFI